MQPNYKSLPVNQTHNMSNNCKHYSIIFQMQSIQNDIFINFWKTN